MISSPVPTLAGYDRPALVATCDLEQTLLEARDLRGDELMAIFRALRRHITQLRPTTTDGYTWFWAHRFRIGWRFTNLFRKREVIVLIPYRHFVGRTSAAAVDRAIAVYTRGSVTTKEVTALLVRLEDRVRARLAQIRRPGFQVAPER